MDPNQNDQNSQGSQMPGDAGAPSVNPTPEPMSAPEPTVTPDTNPVPEAPSEGGMGEVPPPPPAPVSDEPQGTTMGDDHTVPSSDEPAGDSSPAA